jgi:hypothetical protein
MDYDFFWKMSDPDHEIAEEYYGDWDEKERREREEDEPLPGRAL